MKNRIQNKHLQATNSAICLVGKILSSHIVVTGLVVLVMVTSWTPAITQVNWTKYSGNPVVKTQSNNPNDPNRMIYALEPSVLYDSIQHVFKMWFVSFADGGSGFDISYAISLDGMNWNIYAKNPVLRHGSPSSFEPNLRGPSVIFDGIEYKMYYSGQVGTTLLVGLATSPDGINWTKYASNPVLTSGSPGSWDSNGDGYITTYFDGTTYFMWYSGYNGTIHHIGLATSSDGINWSKYAGNPVLSESPSSWDSFNVDAPSIVVVDGVFYLFYVSQSTGTCCDLKVGLATSFDGIHWVKYAGNPVLGPSAFGAWDDQSLGVVSGIFHAGKFHLWYSALGSSSPSWRTGYATADKTIQVGSEQDFSVEMTAGDGVGHHTALEFGIRTNATDSIDGIFGEEELPPKPPLGNFDVRWVIPGTQGTLKDYRDTLGGTHIENIYIGTVQAGSSGFPVTLRWNDSTLPAGTFLLRDATTHGVLYSFNMKTRDSLSLNDESQSSFEIVYNLTATMVTSVLPQWNMLSVPLNVIDVRTNVVFPTATSLAYSFEGEYVGHDSVEKGKAYWLKFNAGQRIAVTGESRKRDTVDINAGWNMIGSISAPVDTAGIIQIPPGLITSRYYYYYGNGYSAINAIEPMLGYWVKANQPGKLVLAASSGSLVPGLTELKEGETHVVRELQHLNQLRISDASGHSGVLYFSVGYSQMDKSLLSRYELPPVPPASAFDVRFSSDRIVNLFSDQIEKGEIAEIRLQSFVCPIKVEWKIVQDNSCQFDLAAASKEKYLVRDMQGEGSVTLTADGLTKIFLKPVERTNADGLPKKFELGQNYPNPFNPETIIPFTIPNESFVSLKVYNSMGQEVATLANEMKLSGDYSVTWQPQSLSSGVYWYRLKAGALTEIKRMTFMK